MNIDSGHQLQKDHKETNLDLHYFAHSNNNYRHWIYWAQFTNIISHAHTPSPGTTIYRL